MQARKLLYVGPSWAVRSFDTPMGAEKDYTNLYTELELSVIDLARPGAGNYEMLDLVRQQNTDYDGIIWVFAEPLLDPTWNQDSLTEIIECNDFWAQRDHIYQQTMVRILSETHKPIAMIGAHSDVRDCIDPRITVISQSWQKCLADAVGVRLQIGWGADVLHRMIMTECPDATPSLAVVDAISDQFRLWKQMELRKVFNWVHPTKLGNKIFAQEIKQKLQQWLKQL